MKSSASEREDATAESAARRSRRLAGIGAIALAVGAAALPSAAAAEETSESPGRAAFVQYCASCHGADAKGDGPMAAELTTPPADLTRLAQKYGTPLPEPKLVAFIDGRQMVRAHGSTAMPVWGRRLIENVPPGAGTEVYKRGTIQLILDYLATVQQETTQP